MAYGFHEDKSKALVYTTDEVYNKDEVYPKSDVYTKNEINQNFYPKSNVYNKTEINNLVYTKDDIDDKVVGKMEIHQFDGSGGGSGSSAAGGRNVTFTIVTTDDASVLIDAGDTGEDFNIVNQFCQAYMKSGKDHFDAWVITHWHSDHAGGYQNIINTGLIKSSTNVFVQLDPRSNNSSNTEESGAVSYINRVRSALSAVGASMVTPTDGQVKNYGSIKVTFYNTNPSYVDDYNLNSWANNGMVSSSVGTDGIPILDRRTSMNNFSLIARFECGLCSYVELGDIEGRAQGKNMSKMKPCTVARVPHHGANLQGRKEFFDRLDPKCWLLSNHFAGDDGIYTHINMARWQNGYFSRYLSFYDKDPLILTNGKSDATATRTTNASVHIYLEGGEVVNYTGDKIDKNYRPPTTVMASDDWIKDILYTTNVWGLIPPAKYYENPYMLIGLSLTSWFNDCWPYFADNSSYAKFYIGAWDDAAYRAGTPHANNNKIHRYLINCFAATMTEDTSEGMLEFQVTSDGFTATRPYAVIPYNQLSFIKDSDYPNGFRWFCNYNNRVSIFDPDKMPDGDGWQYPNLMINLVDGDNAYNHFAKLSNNTLVTEAGSTARTNYVKGADTLCALLDNPRVWVSLRRNSGPQINIPDGNGGFTSLGTVLGSYEGNYVSTGTTGYLFNIKILYDGTVYLRRINLATGESTLASSDVKIKYLIPLN